MIAAFSGSLVIGPYCSIDMLYVVFSAPLLCLRYTRVFPDYDSACKHALDKSSLCCPGSPDGEKAGYVCLWQSASSRAVYLFCHKVP